HRRRYLPGDRMSQSGESAQQPGLILATVLQLWDEIVHGRAAEPFQLDDWPLIASSVGGYLANRGDELASAPQLRGLLRSWLRPRPRPGISSGAAELEFETFLVSWALSDRPDAVQCWEQLSEPQRMDPAAHIARATGWGTDKPSAATAVRYPYLDWPDLDPNNQAGELVDAAVAALPNSRMSCA